MNCTVFSRQSPWRLSPFIKARLNYYYVIVMPEDQSKERLSEKYILYQILMQNMESMKEQLELVEQQLIELKSTSMSMEDMEKMSESNEIFLPLGSGCFGSGKITDTKKMLVNVGAGVFISKDVKSARSSVESNFKELEKAGVELEEQMKKTVGQINEIATEIQEAAQKEG